MPQMGESIAEGTVSKWLKQVGDAVDRDEPILEISTDKVDAEIPSPAAGVLVEVAVGEGETVEVGTVVDVTERKTAVISEQTRSDDSAPVQARPRNARAAAQSPSSEDMVPTLASTTVSGISLGSRNGPET